MSAENLKGEPWESELEVLKWCCDSSHDSPFSQASKHLVCEHNGEDGKKGNLADTACHESCRYGKKDGLDEDDWHHGMGWHTEKQAVYYWRRNSSEQTDLPSVLISTYEGEEVYRKEDVLHALRIGNNDTGIFQELQGGVAYGVGIDFLHTAKNHQCSSSLAYHLVCKLCVLQDMRLVAQEIVEIGNAPFPVALLLALATNDKGATFAVQYFFESVQGL